MTTRRARTNRNRVFRFAQWSLFAASFTVLAAPAATWRASDRLDAVLDEAIADGITPGAVLVVGRRTEILHRKAYGYRSLAPERETMTLDTIFDCASLTKVMATAPAIMQLVEQGKLRLNDRLTKHLPDFADGESDIRIVDLLTHFSGLRPDVDLEPEWSGYETGIAMAYRETPIAPLRSRFIYSDINYLLLAEVVRKMSGLPLDRYAAKYVFEPLGMSETQFRPPAALRPRIAPTERLPNGEILRGVVHDPTTRYMGGVAGHAGVFSTADDLSRFARMMLNSGQGSNARLGKGRAGDARVLSPLSVLKMTTPQSPPDHPAVRGLGWDLDSPYASPRGDLWPLGSFGHTGFTGTSMWIDPFTETYVVLMTNRVHPAVATSVVDLRSKVATIVAAALEDFDVAGLRERAWAARLRQQRRATGSPRAKPVLTGLEVVARDRFKPFQGKRVGLITNHTGIDRKRRRNIDLFAEAPGVELAAILSPEHGLAGRLDQARIADSADTATGTPVYSLYQGDRRRPTAEMLRGIDVLVFDIQDVGARFYTYVTTMAYAMEEAARHDIPFYVLDRPNPLTGVAVEGPMLDESYRSFIGYFPMPVRHGMTAGELARMFNQEGKIGVELTVIAMEGWARTDWFDETGLPWVDPSPNIRTLEQALLYPGIALLEGLPNYSVGRGTSTPFEFVGADWMDGEAIAAFLNGRNLTGVRFYPAERTPTASRFAGKPISGVQISVLDRDAVQPTLVGLELAAALLRFHSDRIDLDRTAKLIGNAETIQALGERRTATAVWALWERAKRRFLPVRRRYLLY